MAKMYPASLYEADTSSPGEVKLFDALRDQLDESWEAYHSTSWTVREGERGSWDGEIDFVVAHPDQGVLCIEAKGGAVSFDEGRWLRRERGAWIPYDRDPFRQAVTNQHALRRLMNGTPTWKERNVLLGHAVSFPNVPIRVGNLPPSAPRQIILDRDDVATLAESLARTFSYHRGEKHSAPGRRGMDQLREQLVPRLEIEVPMAERFLDEEVQLIQLTHDQTMLLRRFGRDRRVVAAGCAGSGKTVLAIEQAKWLKREKGLEVAFVCFNRKLAEHLRQREQGSGIHIFNFHSLCVHLGHRAPGVTVPSHDGDPPQEFWDEELPNVLADAASELGGVYDAIMVDEAQDFHNHWLTALMTTLKDEAESYVWLFMDANQQVYEAHLDVPEEFRPFDLTVNCRNTQAIHREVMKKYRGEVVPEVRGPEGRPVELYQVDDQPAKVAALIEELCGKEEVPPQDVVVLSSHGFANSEVARSLPGRYQLVEKRNQGGNRIFFSSIRGFKGLESKVVILCELEDIDEMSRDAQLYVGISRAVNHCAIVVPKP